MGDAQRSSGHGDLGWSVELALPWAVLAECANRPPPPRDRDTWRVNLSRLHWTLESEADRYIKAEDAEAVAWVWSPQGAVDMHLPEMWGFVQFSSQRAGQQETVFQAQPEKEAVRILRSIYDMQRIFLDRHGRYSTDLDSLGLEYQILRDFLWPPDSGNGNAVRSLTRGTGRSARRWQTQPLAYPPGFEGLERVTRETGDRVRA